MEIKNIQSMIILAKYLCLCKNIRSSDIRWLFKTGQWLYLCQPLFFQISSPKKTNRHFEPFYMCISGYLILSMSHYQDCRNADMV